MTDEDVWEDYDSGPFCVHWSESGDCDEVCDHCGHTCNQHLGGNECDVDGCECDKNVDEGACLTGRG